MRTTRIPKPKRIGKIPKRVLDVVTKKEKANLLKALKTRKDLDTPEFKIRFYKH